MPSTETTYDFCRCKLCGQHSAHPTFPLAESTVYACRNCNFHFLDHLDKTDEKYKQLTESSRHYIETREKDNFALHPARLELVKRCADPDATKLLDIGAGIGQFQRLASQYGFNCRGIEPSSLRRQYAEEKWGLQLNKELVESNDWQIHYCRAFDVITLWDVIEHVNFPRETLEAAAKLLKPGGILLLDTPSRLVPAYKISQCVSRLGGGLINLFLSHFYSTAPYGHKQIFTPQQLINLLNVLGFRITILQKSYTTPKKGNKIILAAVKTK
jgi:2-polyprenyl-3-methyl-5-hydroxy-6-metoxy-1,4-benzoquinol methylase